MTRLQVAFACALLFGAGCALAGNGLPSAEKILKRYVKATGGRAAYKNRHSDHIVGEFEVAGVPAKGTVMMYHQAPDKSYGETGVPFFGKGRMGTDGQTAWEIPFMGEPKVREGGEREFALLAGRLNSEIEWRELYRRVETVGAEEVDGKRAYVVVKTPQLAEPVTEYYDARSHLLVKTITKMPSADGELIVEALASDYRKEGGVLIPHRIVMKAAGQVRIITIRSVTVNQDAPPGAFDLPAEIQALLK